MVHTPPLQFIIVLVCLLFVFSSAAAADAVPITRSPFLSTTQESSETQAARILDEFDTGIEGRMDLEREDYPGTGANNRHDPRTPARV